MSLIIITSPRGQNVVKKPITNQRPLILQGSLNLFTSCRPCCRLSETYYTQDYRFANNAVKSIDTRLWQIKILLYFLRKFINVTSLRGQNVVTAWSTKTVRFTTSTPGPDKHRRTF